LATTLGALVGWMVKTDQWVAVRRDAP